jgi:hypothetical protein
VWNDLSALGLELDKRTWGLGERGLALTPPDFKSARIRRGPDPRRRYGPTRAGLKRERSMAKDAYDSGVTAEQRQEIRRLCHEARVPDKSGEMFTRETAQTFIEQMKAKVQTASR